MKLSTPFLTRLLKLGAVTLATANLTALFGFQYGLAEPAFAQNAVLSSETSASSGSLTLPFGLLSYDGSTDLDALLLDGVTATDKNGADLRSSLKISIKPSGNIEQKYVIYRLRLSDATRLSQKRTLNLAHYAGPSITVSNNLPEMDMTSSETIVSSLAASHALQASDGYGNDITSSVTASVTTEEQEDGTLLLLTFSVTNRFGDTATARASLFTPDSSKK